MLPVKGVAPPPAPKAVSPKGVVPRGVAHKPTLKAPVAKGSFAPVAKGSLKATGPKPGLKPATAPASSGNHGRAGAVVPVPTPPMEVPVQVPYQEGQYVVHPKYGLGQVDRIAASGITEQAATCLEITFPYLEMKLSIPVEQVHRSGLRPPIGRKDIDDIYAVLRGRATFDAKRRSAKRVIDYRRRLSLGDPTSLAESVRDLARLSLKKSLSYEERRILGTALRILSREVALARGREPDDVREEIEEIVYR